MKDHTTTRKVVEQAIDKHAWIEIDSGEEEKDDTIVTVPAPKAKEEAAADPNRRSS